VKTPGQRIEDIELQAMVRTEVDTAAAVQAYIDLSLVILADRINRAGGNACPASDTMLLTNHNTASLPLAEGIGWTRGDTGRRIAAETDERHKAGRQTPGRVDANAGAGPGNLPVNQPGAGQRTGVATDTAVNSGGGQKFHQLCFNGDLSTVFDRKNLCFSP
jgi:hypothetical protein